MSAPIYTASQIATALGVKRQTIQGYLDPVAPDHRLLVNGVQAKAWSFGRMPERLRQRLTETAKARNYRDAEHLLSAPPQQWEPAIPMAELDRSCTEAAAKLQRALGPSLARRNDMRLSGEEFDRLGTADYAREFGHEISPRHFRTLLDRTLKRDGGDENWGRLDIYLGEQLKRRREAPAAFCASLDGTFREIHETLGRFRNALEPTPTEEALLWVTSFEMFERLQEEGEPAKKLRRQLLRFLWNHALWIAKSFNALRVKFDDKLERWIASGQDVGAVVDGRTKRRGVSTAAPYDQDSLDKITYHAVANCGGRISQAVRELVDDDALDPQMLKSFLVKRANKSSIPNRLRESVRCDVAALLPHHQGSRAADKLIPPLDLSYDGVFSMTAVQADDFTMPVYFHVPDGQGWFTLTRGQVLLAIDWRTLSILSYCLHPEGQYNSLLIRTLFTRTFDAWGIPDILYFERGIWKTSKLVTGGEKAAKAVRGDLPFSDAEVEIGLRQFGITFIHARRARSKPVERVGGILQDYMEREPSYCGRDERKDCPEIVTRNKRLVEARQKHPAEAGFYSLEQWEKRFAEICARYNAAPQDGKRLQGLSPEQALQKFWNREDPPTQFGPQHRYLLAHHKIPVTVKPDAVIEFSVRGEKYRYFDAETGRRKGQKLIAWFDPEAPDLCTFTDMAMKNPFSVTRSNRVNGLFPNEVYEAEVSKAQRAARETKTRYRILKAKFAPSFRGTIATRETEDLGRHIAGATAAARDRSEREQSRAAAIQRKAAELGMRSDLLHGGEQTLRALELMTSARREEEESNRLNGQTPAAGESI